VLQLRGYNAVRLTLYESLLTGWHPKTDEEAELRADALQAMGDVLQFLDRRDDAIENYDQALAIYRQVGDRLGEANTLQAIGLVQTDLAKGVECLQAAQVLYEQIGSLYGQGVNLYYLGGLHAQQEQSESAATAWQQAISCGQQINFSPLIEAAEKALASIEQPK
ncbi:MAG: tetratricopeptide repeat protein, partial [Cyanobacteria bacterium J06632_3]